MSKYSINESTVKGIADAVRGLTHAEDKLTTDEIIDTLSNNVLGFPTSPNICGKIVNGKWIRPSDWPDITALSENIEDDEECVYLTYKISRYPTDAWIGITAEATKWAVERGHIESDTFIADEYHELSGNVKFIQLLDPEYGDVQLWRIKPLTGHMIKWGFTQNATSGNMLYNQLQPCVEEVIHLPYFSAFGSIRGMSANTSYFALVTIWTEKVENTIATKVAVDFGGEQTFNNGYCLCEIDFRKMDTSTWTSFPTYLAFANCYNLQYLDLSPLDLNGWSQKFGIRETFLNCYRLKRIKFGNWNTANWELTQLYAIFNGCFSLQEIDLSWINSANWVITTMIDIFNNCRSLHRIDLSSLNTSNWPLNSLYRTFQDAVNLEEIDMSGMDASQWNITDARNCFGRCYSLRKIKLPRGVGEKASVANGSIYPNDCFLLTDYEGTNNKFSHNLSTNRCLSTDSLLSILENLPTVSSATTITLGSSLISKLTQEQIAVATQKGWTVA